MNPSTGLLVSSFIQNPGNSIGLSGPDNSGKMRIAEYLCVKSLSLEAKEYDFNVKVVDCKNKVGIDEIRDIKKSLAIKSAGRMQAISRAIIFKDFHNLSIPAQNSILKLLEEPPEDTMLVILVNTKNNILPTIVSRLQWIEVLPIGFEDLQKKYGSYGTDLVKTAYLLSDGHLINFENILNENDKVSLKSAIEDAKKILKMKKPERISSIDLILNNKDYDAGEFLNALQKIYSALVRKEVKESSSRQQRVIAGLENIIKTKESLKYNANSKLIFTNLFYKI